LIGRKNHCRPHRSCLESRENGTRLEGRCWQRPAADRPKNLGKSKRVAEHGIAWIIAVVVIVLTLMKADKTGDYAPGWRVRCPKCGCAKPASELGFICLGRIGSKPVLVKCRGRSWRRIQIINRASKWREP